MAPMLALGVDIRRVEEYDLGLVQQMVSVWRRAADLILNGDYYALTPPGGAAANGLDGNSAAGTLAGAWSRPSAIPVALTRSGPSTRDASIRSASYELVEAESGERFRLRGSALQADGLVFKLAPRSGSIWFYERSS